MKLTIKPELKALIPPLAEDERKQLEQNIIADGCREPLVVWKNGDGETLLDGHNRHEICERNGIPFEVTHQEFDDQSQAVEWMIYNQLGRRNMEPYQKCELVMPLEKIFADRANANQGTRTDLPDNIVENSPQGKTREQMAALAGVSDNTYTRAKKINESADEETKNALRKSKKDGGKSINQAFKEVQKKERAKEIAESRAEVAEKAAKIKPSDRFKIEHCDLADYTPPEQVDLIITDPPYPREFLPCFETLAMKANEWLKDGGIAIIMSGQAYLDQVYSMMSKHMDYYWTGCYYTPGQPTPLRHVNVNTTWKPLLIYQKRSDKYKGRIFGDVCKSDGNDKDHHKWGQSISGMDDILNKFALPGQTILDPFLGAGTTGISAVKRGCIFYGCEMLEENFKISQARIGEQAND